MALKWKSKWVSTSLTSTISVRRSNSATRLLLTLCTFPIQESHFSKKQPQEIIPIAFLFSQLHFNNVTSDNLFHCDHLVMHSIRCTVQNEQITLIFLRKFDFAFQCRRVLLYNYIPVLSTLPDNPGDSRFWTVSPGLQIREWNLPDILWTL